MSGEPDFLVVLQVEPVAHVAKNGHAAKDAVSAILLELGFQPVEAVSEPLARAHDGVHCRLDSSRHATIVARTGDVGAVDVPIPHDLAGLSDHLLAEGVAHVYIATDSVGRDGRLDRDLFARDVAGRHVMGATVVVQSA